MQDTPTILIVDDQVDNLKVLFNTLKPNYRVRVANSGAEALEIVRRFEAPDLFLLDIMMPEMDGYTLCQRLKTTPGASETPVIFLTARDRPEDEERGFDVGAVDYVTKPVNARLVQARIKAQLALARQLNQARTALQASNRLIALVTRDRDDQETQNALLAREIAERKQVEAALRESQARFARMTSQLADRLFFFTNAPSGELVYITDGIKQLLGVALPEDALGQSWRNLADWSPESLVKVLEESQRWLTLGEKTRFGLSFRHPQADWRQLEIHAYRVLDQERGQELIEGIALDVTEQRALDGRLRTLGQAVEHAPVSVTVTDPNGNILYVNPHFTRLSGYTKEEVLGKNPRLLSSGEHDDAFYQEMWATLHRGDTWRGELINKNKQGEMYWVETAISPVFDEQGVLQSYVAVKQDIKDRKELERIKEDVERIMRHDLRTPLNVVINVPDLLLMDDDLSADLREEIGLIREAGHRMLGMIELSLDLFKMETGQLNYSASRVDLIRILQDVCASIAQLLNRKQLRLAIRRNGQSVSPKKADSGGQCVEMIAADARLLVSMLGNLLTNAVDASPPGETISLDIQVNEQDNQTKEWVRLDICNQGAVPPPMRGHFFEKYRTHGKAGGTGLGTYSAKLMADTMGFELTMSTSDADDRTRIHLRMPSAATAAATMDE
ncbi:MULTISPECIES: PAS domain S-box protein [Thiorhodovibrio]|uniref:PAS domain S-box protein n=1 Tax=Thiorhodovibrio TaxID=61593 RepID=UPI0019115C32|nr:MULTISPECIES: PAS domain S-box protein [Thiorhodovibrio]MBK5970171.1 hybrid sensor histidine kinase/response regulator [Thiorhodovibrio winogradskyi]WPL13996.1 Nitrogen fixation regulatory protein [Thiorhodovibrio litoralis]